ncbi:pentapeptide repeat-containing protein [Nonomuraea pusilla]|uniref:pentapeptide repeat-containing protein n=1 Tax=Nonomuraea pusilla TaxID=46177 RepID=UPI0015A55689|nr:pentapeptide repeat-containing protein [Nonomuraea pusilla]
MTSRQALPRRALIWSTSVVVVIVSAAVALHLLAGATVWWRPALERLPRYLAPPYSAADLLPAALTVLGAVVLLIGVGCWFTAERGTLLQRTSTRGVVLGVVLVAGSLVYTDARSMETVQEGRSVDRYDQAVERLGSREIEVRLDAIRTLRRLARDSQRDRVTTVDVMAAYVREHDSMAKAGLPGQPAADVQMALTVLGSVYDAPDTELGHDWVCSCDLTRIRVPGADLSGLNLGTAVLTRADLRGARLSGADLASADLSGADLRRAYLDGADLRHAVLFVADLGEAYLNGADLSGVDLFKAKLRRADLREADLSGVDLFDADLRGADLRGVNLSGASLSGADLREADLREAILRGADLRGTNLKGADLTGADLTGTNLKGADLTGADLTGTHLNVKAGDETELPARAAGA